MWFGFAPLGNVMVAAPMYVMPFRSPDARDSLVNVRAHQGKFHLRVQAPGVQYRRGERFVTTSDAGTVARVKVIPGEAGALSSCFVTLANPHHQSALIFAQSELTQAEASLPATAAIFDNTRFPTEAELATSRADAEAASMGGQAARGLVPGNVIARLDYLMTMLDADAAREQVGLTEQWIAVFARIQTAHCGAADACCRLPGRIRRSHGKPRGAQGDSR